jgi:hypothetical protein
MKEYKYMVDTRARRVMIIRPDGIRIEGCQLSLHFELERRLGIARVSELRVDNSETIKMLYRVLLEMSQYVPFEEVHA